MSQPDLRTESAILREEVNKLRHLADESHAHLTALGCPLERYGELLTVPGRIAWLREHLESVLEKFKEVEASDNAPP